MHVILYYYNINIIYYAHKLDIGKKSQTKKKIIFSTQNIFRQRTREREKFLDINFFSPERCMTIKSLYNNNVLKLERRKIFSTKNFKQKRGKYFLDKIFLDNEQEREKSFLTLNYSLQKDA